MPDQEEKRIIVKVAYNYFQSGKWDRALDEYKKLLDIDPMDFLVHNMIAEIYFRKGEKERAVVEYLKAASLLRATNNIEKAIHTYNYVLKIDPENTEAKAKIEEGINVRLAEVDDLISRYAFKPAYEICERLANKLMDNPLVEAKLRQVEQLEKDLRQELPETAGDSTKDEVLNKDVIVKNLYAMAERYEEKQAWDEAVEAYITILRFLPEDETSRNKLRLLYRKTKHQEPADEVINREPQALPRASKPAVQEAPAAPRTPPPKVELNSTVTELEKLRMQAEEQLRQAVEDRREREKLKSSGSAPIPAPLQTPAPAPAVPAIEPAEERAEQDLRILLTQAQMYIHQNLLVEAMRLCQKILEFDPQNKEVRGLLKQIYDKKNL